jgi:hypothetical protein
MANTAAEPPGQPTPSGDAKNPTDTSRTPRAAPPQPPSQRRTPMGPPATRPTPGSRADAQLATLRALQDEERELYRRLHRVLRRPEPAAPRTCLLPSTHAHTQPLPGVTDAQRAEALREAKRVVGEHIARLGRYNEIRDVGMGLIGIVADMRSERVRDVQGEFGVGDGD